MENLARYTIRASFSQERMTYIREESKVIYKSNDGWQQKAFDALEWLAAMPSHIPDIRRPDAGKPPVRFFEGLGTTNVWLQ